MDTGMAYATNPGNFRLEMSDFTEDENKIKPDELLEP
jgi:hypothetical protein